MKKQSRIQTEAIVAAREGKTIEQLRLEHDEAVAANEAKAVEDGVLERARTVEEIRSARLAEEKLIAERWEWKRSGSKQTFAEWQSATAAKD